jgi:hypothetical protein
MKKLMALAIAVFMIAAICAIPAAASDLIDLGPLYEFPAEKYEEIVEGEAGEATMTWNVPYQAVTPVLDGVINKNEYARFENFEDYIGVSTSSNYGKEAAQALYEKVIGGFFEAYWCWDGQYLYMAFDISCPDGYFCPPDPGVYLFAYNCLQIGMADVEASGRDSSYVELGFGYDNVNDKEVTFAWAPEPARYQSGEEDFAASYNENNQQLIYELRIDLQPALGWEKYPENGDQVNFAFVLEVAGENDTNTNAQVLFCHGIGGQYSMKMTEYFALITFEGKPDDVVFDPTKLPELPPEDIEYELREFIDFSNVDVFNTILGDGAKVEQVSEGADTFLRVTAEADGAYIYSTAYPRQLLSEAKYLVIKYRTNSEKADECGIIWTTRQDPDFRIEECYFDFMTGDGNWNYLLCDMNGDGKWIDYINTLGIVPFYEEEGIAGETIDIAWIKCYNQDPTDLYEQYMPTTEETTAEPTDETTAADVTTNAPEQSVEQTTAPATSEKKSCGSVVGAGVLVVVAVFGCAVVLKKKD